MLHRIKQGQHFGESVLTGQRRAKTHIAKTYCEQLGYTRKSVMNHRSEHTSATKSAVPLPASPLYEVLEDDDLLGEDDDDFERPENENRFKGHAAGRHDYATSNFPNFPTTNFPNLEINFSFFNEAVFITLFVSIVFLFIKD